MGNPIYDLMYRGESGAAGYNAFNRGTFVDANGRERIRPGTPPMDFSRFTLGEIQDMQHLGRRDPDRVFAIGKYQIIPDTMDAAVARLGLDRNQQFTPELQDSIFSEYLLREKQPTVRDYIEGRPGATLHEAQHGLSKEWASFGDPDKGGRSHYGGANQAHITLEQSAEALNQLRQQYREAIDQGMTPEQAWRTATAIGSGPQQSQDQTRRPPQQPSDAAVEGKLLKLNSEGPEVRNLQTTLRGLGYTGTGGAPLGVDGDFGSNTDKAVRDFQRAHGLEPVDGKVGPDTRTALAQAAQRPLVSESTHPNHGLYAAIGAQLPSGTDPKVIASVTLQAMENGITSEQKLERMAVSGTDAYLMGVIPGDRVKVDLTAPAPDLQALSDHMREQTQQQVQQQRSQSQAMSI